MNHNSSGLKFSSRLCLYFQSTHVKWIERFIALVILVILFMICLFCSISGRLLHLQLPSLFFTTSTLPTNIVIIPLKSIPHSLIANTFCYRLNFTFPASALPLTASSRPRTMPLSKSTLPTLTRTAKPSLTTTPPTFCLDTFAPVVRLTTLLTDLLRLTASLRTSSLTADKYFFGILECISSCYLLLPIIV